MSDYRHGSHTTFSIHLHIVWITKYRHKALRGEVAERVRTLILLCALAAAAIGAADRLNVGKGHGPVHHFHPWW